MFAKARVTPASEEEDEEDDVYQYSKTAPGPVFAAIENILRCAICRAIADPPVALKCCQQAYCSLCIRQHLDSKTPRCPLCRDAAVPSQLVVSRELRAICSLWKKNRKSIVAAAESGVEVHRRHSAAPGGDDGGSENSGGGPSATPAAGSRGGGAGGRGRGPRHPEKRHGASGEAQERVRAMFYHSMSETALRQKLRELGLPFSGNKAAMVARHKRLVLLDAASADQEVSTPRAELVRRVAAWSRDKDREKKRERAVGLFSPSMFPAGNAQAASAGGQGTEAAGPSAAKPSVPAEMKQGFAKLVAKMKEQQAARKRMGEASKGGDGDKIGDAGGDAGGDERRAKRARLGEGSGDDLGTRCDSDHRGRGESAVSGRAYEEDGFVEGDSGEAMEILGVEGRMVRTRGPWRCVFLKAGSGGAQGEGSTGQGSSEPALGLGSGSPAEVAPGAEGVSESEPGSKARLGSGLAGGSVQSRTTSTPHPACEDSRTRNQDRKGNLQVLASSGSRPNAGVPDRGSRLVGASNGVSKDGDIGRRGGVADGCDERLLGKRKGQPGVGSDDRAAGSDVVNGSEDLPSVMNKRIHVTAPANSGTAPEGGVPEAPDAGAKLSEVLTEDEGILYLNQDTGEAMRDPPPELVDKSEEAEQAGDYLVFVPFRSFWKAVREGGSSERGLGSGESARSEAMEDDGQGVPPDAWDSETPVAHPQTPTSSASPRRGEGTWERLSAGGRTSMDPGASPSHPRMENGIVTGDDDPRSSISIELSKLPDVASGDASSPDSCDPPEGASAEEGRAHRQRCLPFSVSSRGKSGGLVLEKNESPRNGTPPSMPPLAIDLSEGVPSPPSLPERMVAIDRSGSLGNKVEGARKLRDAGGAVNRSGVEGRSRGERRGGDLDGDEGSPRGEEGSTWTCKVCTLENEKRARACAVCRTPKSAEQASQALERQQAVLAKAPVQAAGSNRGRRAGNGSGRLRLSTTPIGGKPAAVEGVEDVAVAATLVQAPVEVKDESGSASSGLGTSKDSESASGSGVDLR